jgi:hypothetical protein
VAAVPGKWREVASLHGFRYVTKLRVAFLHGRFSSVWAMSGPAVAPVALPLDGAAAGSALPRPRVPRMRLGELPATDSRSARIYGCDVDGPSGVRSVRRLECVECGRVSREGGRGWTARLTVDDEVIVLLPGVRRARVWGDRGVAGGARTVPHLRSRPHHAVAGPRLQTTDYLSEGA